MLYHLLYPLHTIIHPFRVFQYVTFRTAAASLTALLICLLLGPWLIARLRRFQIGQQIRTDGPSSHQNKAGTPTMGGILILIGTLLPTLLWANLTNLYVWIAVAATALFGLVGFADDYAKIVRKRSLGLTGRRKLLYQALIALGVCVALYYLAGQGLYSTRLSVPFFKNFTPEMSLWHLGWIPITLPLAVFVVLIIVGVFQRRQPDRRARRPGVRLRHHRRRRPDGPVLCQRPRPVCGIPGPDQEFLRVGADHLLRRHGRRHPGFSLVQRPPGADFHGRRRIPVPGRSHRHRGGADQAGIAVCR